MPCNVPLSNCLHKCSLPCHDHDSTHETQCTHPCSQPLTACKTRNHTCKRKCGHAGPCHSDSGFTGQSLENELEKCMTVVTVSCLCGAIVPAVQIPCHALDSCGLPIVTNGNSNGIGAGLPVMRVDCLQANIRVCVEMRRRRAITAVFAISQTDSNAGARSVELGYWDNVAGKIIGGCGSQLVDELVAVAYCSDGPVEKYDGVWFLDVPGDIGRREISGFLRGHGFDSFEFLGAGHGTASYRPEFPKTPLLISDAKIRRKGSENKIFGAAANKILVKDHIVWFSGSAYSMRNLQVLIAGREGWIVPLLLDERNKGKEKIQPSENVNSSSIQDAVQAAKINNTSTNVYNVLQTQLENENDVILEAKTLEIGHNSPLETIIPIHTQTEPEKKEKKEKKKTKDKEAVAVEKTVEKILDPSIQPKASNLCAFAKCKEKSSTIGYCKFCDRKYCMSHRMAEVHSERCTSEQKKNAMSTFKADAKLGIAIGRGETQGGKSGSLAKEREDAKKRLAEKIKKARK
ncbi:hypothetical protein HK100_006922 [Physocladia obscura]|uniref:AN1-type domain-containing protein n=1 Tax=Physocladia obscura TaxID=109957 RepID=A0AAD5T582_9FUNG|nr:hypothetical protein HK100_006922 [Physocladia obscura]